jgi:hypothetical protein
MGQLSIFLSRNFSVSFRCEEKNKAKRSAAKKWRTGRQYGYLSARDFFAFSFTFRFHCIALVPNAESGSGVALVGRKLAVTRATAALSGKKA